MEQMEFGWRKKKITLSVVQIVIAVAILGGVAFWGGVTSKNSIPFAAAAAVYDTRAPENVDLAPLFKAWHILDDNFAPASTTATSTTAEEKLWGAIQGLAASYGDDYTVFFPPVEKEIFDTAVRGDFQGVGMEIGLRDTILTVIAPIKGTPAFRAGILAGDRIIEIDGVTTKGLQVEEAVGKIRGPKGTKVKLLLSRETKDGGKPFEIQVERDTIVLPTLDTTLRTDGVFVIQLYSFNAQSPQLFQNALNEFAQSSSNKLVIDLRNNPGGYLEAAVDMASWFLPQGDTVVSEDFGKKQEPQTFRSRGYDTLKGKSYSVVVLVNKGSASASEILAGALRDHGRATVIGMQSFGKGSVQQVFDITEKTSLKVTIARWLTPNGTSISHAGITPDIEVDRTEEDVKSGRDPQLDRAVQFLLTGK